MKRALLIVVILMFASLAHASEASHRAAAEKLLEATKAERNLDQLYTAMEDSIQAQFKEMNVPEDALPILVKYQTKQLELVKSELSWKNIKDELASAYMAVYPEDEMKQITKFFNSPVGKKYVDKIPELTQQMMTITQNHIPALVEKARKLGDELEAELDAYDQAHQAKAPEAAPKKDDGGEAPKPESKPEPKPESKR